MYEQFFGLKEKPFSLTPDTEYFYRYSGHQEAFNVLLVALRNGEGFVRITGEVGTGKTLLCRQILKLLEDDCATVYLPNPLLTPLELYQSIAHELQIVFSEEASVQHLHHEIFAELVALKKINRPVVVMIDEAQAMPYRSLEAIRLLSNLETEKEKLLHIFFFAQPEFDQRLERSNLRQLRQRITFSYQLSTLRARELSSYLNHRLRVAGFKGEDLFSSAAVKLLHCASSGVPRVINILAHKSLMVAYGKGSRKIDRSMVVAAIRDTTGAKTSNRLQWPPSLFEFGIVALIAVMTFVVWGALR